MRGMKTKLFEALAGRRSSCDNSNSESTIHTNGSRIKKIHPDFIRNSRYSAANKPKI
jgi:hypothetical protein